MASINEFTFPSSNGTDNIHVKEWSPGSGTPVGVLQIVHGVMEHYGRYDDFSKYMVEKGFIVVGHDHLGHGLTAKNDEDFGYFADKDGWKCVTCDVNTLYGIEKEKYPTVPYFILGHSMGSFLTRTLLIDYPEVPFTGVLLSGTGQTAAPVVSLGRFIVKREMKKLTPRGRSSRVFSLCFGVYNKKFEPVRTPSDWTTSDEQMVDAHMADPLEHFIPTLELFDEMLGGIQYIGKTKNIEKMSKDIPILLFSGEDDPVGDFGKGVKKVYNAFIKTGCKDVTLKLYPNARHEMLNEKIRNDVYAYVSDWIAEKMK